MRIPSLFLSCILCLALGTGVQAATYTVANTNDSGTGSLRQAVIDANATPTTADNIVFSSSAFATAQTIVLASALPSITGDLTITGPTALSARVTVNRASTATTAAFVVADGINASLSVSDLTLTGRGGGILYQGAETFQARRCVVSGATQGIVAVGVSGLIEDCTFTDNSNTGVFGRLLTVRRSTFANNIGGNGYGLQANSSTIENCTFVRNNYGIIELTGGSSQLTINSCTVADNNNGIGTVGGVTILNSLSVGNRLNNIGGQVQADNFSTLSGTAAAVGLETSDGVNAVVLKDNGGLTQTVLLLAGGSALNTGSTSLSTDQRGVGRPKGGAYDRGAFEFDNYPPALSGIETTALNYTPSASSQISSTIAVSDPDFALPLAGATVRISSGFVASEDRLIFATQNGITGSYNATTGVLTLSGSSSIANYQTALRSVQYQNVNTQNPNAGNRVVSFQVDDGSDANNLSNTVSRTINVIAVNDAPVNSVPGAQSTNEDTNLVFSTANGNALSISDADAGAGSLTVTLSVTNGVFAQNNASTRTLTGTVAQINSALATVTYVPTANFFGNSTLTIVTNDNGNTGTGGAKSDTDTVSITVRPVNDNPTANDDSVSVAEDSSATVINVLANDSTAPDAGETLTVTSVTQPTNGTVTLVSGVVRFTPAANFNGTTSFSYTISDGNGGTDTATVNVTVTSVNDNPTATNDSATVPQNSAATVINVLANDSIAPDTGETLTVTAVTQPANGTVTLTSGVVRFAPANNFVGTTTFTYTISDGNGGTATATVTVTVTSTASPVGIIAVNSGNSNIVGIDTSNGAQSLIASPNPLLNNSYGVARASDGTLYVTNFSANTIVKITASGVASTLPTPSTNLLYQPYDIVIGPDGMLYTTSGLFASNSAIVKVNPTTGAQTNVATAGLLNIPRSLAFGPDGNLYVGNLNSASIVKVVVSNGAQSTYANSSALTASDDSSQARVTGIAFGSDGALYFTDLSNDRIKKFVGGSSSSTGVTAFNSLSDPQGFALGNDSNFYVATSGNSSVIQVTPTGAQTVVAAAGNLNGASDVALSDTVVRTISISGPTTVVEGTSGTTDVSYTVSLSAPSSSTVTVNVFTADGTATAPGDYTALTGTTLTFTPGVTSQTVTVQVKGDTVSEADEKFSVNLSNATNAALGTASITTTIRNGNGNDASTAIISEFRLSGAGGGPDDFVELYNNNGNDVDVTGWTFTANGTSVTLSGSIVSRGHLLITGPSYSLNSYATGDVAFPVDIPLVTTLTLRNASGTIMDEVNAGNIIPAREVYLTQYSLVRRFETGVPLDTGNDQNDFNLVAVGVGNSTADATGVAPLDTNGRLGAPGPQNLSSPVQSNVVAPLAIPVGISNETAKYSSASANYNSAASALSAGGQLSFRRTLTNNTGATITRLRFRIAAITAGTSTAAGIADLRAISSKAALLTVPGGVTLNGLFLEAPSVVAGQGGGMNSSWSTVDLTANPLTLTDGTRVTGGLPAGKAANLEFLFAINNAQGGNYRFLIAAELLP